MISSISAFHGGNILGHKLCQKFMPCGIPSDFHIAYLTACCSRRNWHFKSCATEVTRESHQHDKDTDVETNFFDMCCKLSENLSHILEQEDKSIKLPTEPLRKKRAHHQNSFGLILEWQGVIVEEDEHELEPFVWHILSTIEEKPSPSDHILKEIEGIKTEQALSEILRWSDDPNELQRIALQKESIYKKLHGKRYQVRPGTLDFITAIKNYDVPIALVSNLSRSSLKEAVDSIGWNCYFDALVSVQDVERGKPEPDLYELASKQIGICPERCVVFGNTDLVTETARAAGMSCVAVASRYPVYELRAADYVVRWLDQVSFRELQALADGDPIGARAQSQANYMEIVFEE